MKKGIGTRRTAEFPGFVKLKHMTKQELIDVGNVLLKGDIRGLRRIVADPTMPVLVATFASVLLKIYERGDMAGFDLLISRFLGKIPQSVLHDGQIGGTSASTVIVTMPSNGREAKTIDVKATTLPTMRAEAAPELKAAVQKIEEEYDFG